MSRRLVGRNALFDHHSPYVDAPGTFGGEITNGIYDISSFEGKV